MKTFFLNRKEHDALLDSDNTLLRDMFRFPHQWSIAGVTFFGICDEYANCVRQSIINAIQECKV